MALADKIVVALSGDEATVAELANRLGTSEQAVTSALFAGHGRFRCDRGSPAYWSLASAPKGKKWAPLAPTPVAAVSPLGSLGLYPWQADALNAWDGHGCRGVVEAVTGTGKTMVGVAAALEELARRGQVLVLVPTVELQHQWVAQIEPRVPAGRRVGRLGGGADDTLVNCDVLVAVVNSARSADVRLIRPGGLLVADECHRYGSAANQLALDPRFRRRLGLSATYARDDDGNLSWLDPYFGGTCFRLGYARAVADGVTARFTVTLIGVELSPPEQASYDELTEMVRRLRARLVNQLGIPAAPFEAFLRAVMVLADGEGEGSSAARAYRQAMLERRRLLADTPAKHAGLELLAQAMTEADRTIVFTQSIAASERAAAMLSACGLRADVMHSRLVPSRRLDTIRRFAAGEIVVLAAPRVLDEGIDVPVADLAVIASASRSRRQMIQRMGRILRKKPDGRRARFAVLFVEGTVEDPRCGAHEAFFDEIIDVADQVWCFPANVVADRPEAVLGALRQ